MEKSSPYDRVEEASFEIEARLREAGRILLARREWCGSTRKADDTVLTAADLEVQGMLVKQLRRLLPGFAIIAEEDGLDGTAPAGSPAIFLDPLDGTRIYADGGSDWAVCCGAAAGDGAPLLGMIFQPARRRFFLWTPRRGPSCNGLPLPACQPSANLPGAYLHVHSDGHRHLPPGDEWYKLAALGSTSAHFARLFEDRAGRVLALLMSRYGRWDLCGGALQIAAALGAQVRTLGGEVLGPEQLLLGAMRHRDFKPLCLVGSPANLDALAL